MDQVLVQGIEKWLKKYPWLWAIRKSWVDVRIRAKKISTAIDLVQALSVGKSYIYAETENGPIVLEPKASLVGKPEALERGLMFLRLEVQHRLRFIAVEVGNEITIYKQQGGWSLEMLGEAWSIAGAQQRSRQVLR